MLSDEDLILRLEAWTEYDFHIDRQLADEILIAHGWKCEPDSTFEGGIRWYWGTNPQISSAETTRPHPINDLNAAVGLVPRGYRFMLDKRPFAETRKDGQSYRAHVWSGDHPSFEDTISWAPEPTVALCIAVFRARRASRMKRPEAVAGPSLLKPAVTMPSSALAPEQNERLGALEHPKPAERG